MTKEDFFLFSKFLRDNYGINLNEDKIHLLEFKISKLMKKHNLSYIKQYISLLQNKKNKELIIELLNEVTVNKTNFFREINHFNFIKNHINLIVTENKRIRKNLELRIWSSACSTGEEAYTLGIILSEYMPNIDIKILATDISHKVLKKAVRGEYPKCIEKEIPIQYLQKYFNKNKNSYTAKPFLKNMITFRSFNLKDQFIFKNNFDIIFCRNVMIYFDNEFQDILVNKFYRTLEKGGLLFIGHSESLSQLKHNFKYIQPTIYMK